MLRRRWPWLVLALVVVAALAFYLVPRSRVVDVVEVTRGPVSQSVVATGRLATPARIEISSQLVARIERVAVREGDAVSAGSALVELRSEEAQAALASSTAALAEAGARVRQLAQVQRPVANQQLLQAEAALRLAQAEDQRARELKARGFVSQARVDEAERALASARAGEQAALAQALASREGGVEVELAMARLRQAQANFEAARARLDLLVLRAPTDARVLTRTAEPGDTAQAGRTLLTLAEDGETRIIASVDEKNLRHVRDGLAASAVADAFPGQPFEARVYYVAPSIDAQRGTVEMRLVVPRPPAFLRPDMTVSVEVVVGRREDAVRLPAEAIRDPDSQAPSVLVLRDGRAARVPVRPGLRGVGVVEVPEGLAAGDLVILPSSQAEAGERVRARARTAPRGNAQVPPGMGG